jgi:hypothetical protein
VKTLGKLHRALNPAPVFRKIERFELIGSG